MISECVLQGTSIHFLKEQGSCFQPSRYFNFDFTAINIGENSLTQFQQENCRVSGKVNCSTISYSSVILRRSLEFYYILGNTTSETTSQLSFFFFAFIPRQSFQCKIGKQRPVMTEKVQIYSVSIDKLIFFLHRCILFQVCYALLWGLYLSILRHLIKNSRLAHKR